MMDTLAVVGHSDGGGLSRAHDVLRGGDEGLLVAFFGDLDEEQAAVAARMRQRSRGAVAFVLDSGDWTRGGESVAPAPASERLRLLREAGWTALAVPPVRSSPASGSRRARRTPACGPPRPERRQGSPGSVMSGRTRLALCAFAATMTAAGALLPLVETSTWVLQAAFLLAVQTGVGTLARRMRTARFLTVSLQVFVTLLTLTMAFARDHAVFGVLPGPQAGRHLMDLLTMGADDVGRYAIPAPATEGIRLMLIGGVLLIGLAVDVLAVTFRAAAPAGLPLLALYSVAAGLSDGGAGWLWFLLAACGYLALLLAEGRDRLSRWGRVFGGVSRTSGGLAAGLEDPGARPRRCVRGGASAP